MRRIALLFCSLIVLMPRLVAQNSILAGKITDGHDRPIIDAVIAVEHDSSTNSDKDGLYYTSIMKPGHYVVTITIKGKKMRSVPVDVPDMQGVRQYYNFKISAGKVQVEQTISDPFVAAVIAEREKDGDRDLILDEGRRTIMVSTDSSGKIRAVKERPTPPTPPSKAR
jgi:Carboxypeptidase regulatory-like domain